MRYILLVLLNVPVILLALVNIITGYKMHKVTPSRFRHQLIIWLTLLVILVGSFPIYNILTGKSPTDSSELSLFDIVQTTAIVFLFYVLNEQRQKSEQMEQRLHSLHRALSIRLSTDEKLSEK